MRLWIKRLRPWVWGIAIAIATIGVPPDGLAADMLADVLAFDRTLSDRSSSAFTPIPDAPQLAACCKICRKGKACGNSCIKRTYSCGKPPGCACDGVKPVRGPGTAAILDGLAPLTSQNRLN